MAKLRKTRSSSVLAHLRQLCCLGMGWKIIMPELIETLRDWVAFSSSILALGDEQHRMGEVYSKNTWPDSIVHLYLDRFIDGEEGVYPSFTALLKGESFTYNSNDCRKRFIASDLYRLCIAPLQIDHILRVVIRKGNRRFGVLALYRTHSRGFSHQDELRMIQITPYIAHAFASMPAQAHEFLEGEERGVIIVNRTGEIQHICEEGRYLLWLAAHPQPRARDLSSKTLHHITHKLTVLRNYLTNIFQGKYAPPPSLPFQNVWGKFVFNAHWVEPAREGHGLIVVTVHRQIPRVLKMSTAMRHLPLSPRERETCLMLGKGLSQSEIAKHMNVTRHTVASNVRTIYDKLSINSRDDLLAKLLLVGPTSRIPPSRVSKEFKGLKGHPWKTTSTKPRSPLA